MKDISVISLFSGCGGLDLGFIKAGFNIIFANDIDKEACESYKQNIGNHIVCKDIYKLDSKEIPNGDILIGGFPCLGFTIANGKNRDLNSHYNTLYLEYARVLKDKQPKYFLVENVAGIQSGKGFKEHFYEKILPTFESCGYDVKHKILNASDFFVPQNRKRVIILGKRKDIQKEVNFPKPIIESPKTLRDAIFDLPSDYSELIPNHTGSRHKIQITGYIGNRILQWDKPAPTITGRGSRGGGAVIHPHPNLQRRLSVRECARIQSFPDDFIFYGSNGACFAQIGNAVPPLMSFFIANEFREAFGLEKIDLNKKLWNLRYVC
ncbi:DNA (cytosine-5-)-methyltransferase [Helicobacter saguini]|uniref:DNA (cytosine-5-)-methyltransferase n=1 Tax=Helicobacter saguini TaxID=1548018 RepID=A0A347VQ60_9HELI|nr:DNA cytosine methyltransferase [Helicobacter saguini]MWV61064.1 DNA (cytosine-5-)-methyltransferase [Helicobacter saguini]MWV68267.1 DNA (cytosine-5-)-methyltransferase [Helicobacter saguini]MWV70268.1 DNA (cytosine-5-)-methyltransferase [Helicobacter saguini]MWV72171.1 DNA (cytosine-5-)-methyltransferase [Helicobacter saguini]TLD95231.1 DNA cytosine methyltransferase [Helicobacter saguini]